MLGSVGRAFYGVVLYRIGGWGRTCFRAYCGRSGPKGRSVTITKESLLRRQLVEDSGDFRKNTSRALGNLNEQQGLRGHFARKIPNVGRRDCSIR